MAGEPADEATLKDLVFAWRAIRCVKSNAILLAHDQATVGIGMGQVNRVDSCHLAVDRANTLADGADRATGSVAASDAFFPFADGAETLMNAGVKAIVQPGGSILALLKDLNARLGLTIVLITHQMQVVKDICTDLAVMSHGKVVDDGSILDVFDHPSNELTREFIYTSGNMNKGITLVQEHPLFSKERESGSVYLLFSVGSGAEETLMADIRERFGVRGNIMFGNVDVIHGTPVGMILVSLDGPAEAVSKALAYFPTVGVSATPLADLHVNEVEENDNE